MGASPIYQVPIIVLVGEMAEKPWVVNGEIVSRPVLPIEATIDHRWVDGQGIAGMSETFQKYLANPWPTSPRKAAPRGRTSAASAEP